MALLRCACILGLTVWASAMRQLPTRRVDGIQQRDFAVWGNPLILLAAARDGDHVAVLNAIDHEVDLESTRPNSGRTALYTAPYRATGRTALFEAAANGHLEIVQLLLAHDASTDAVDRTTGRTALLEAAAAGHDEIVALLLSRDVNEEVTDLTGDGIAHLAAKAGHHKVLHAIRQAELDRLFERFDGRMGFTALMAAAGGLSRGHTACVGMLVDRKSDGVSATHLNTPQELHGLTPLMLAAAGGNVETVMYLIAKGASLDVQDKQGYTALHYAIERGNLRAAEMVWKAGASTDLFSLHRVSVKQLAQFSGPDMQSFAKLLPAARLKSARSKSDL